MLDWHPKTLHIHKSQPMPIAKLYTDKHMYVNVCTYKWEFSAITVIYPFLSPISLGSKGAGLCWLCCVKVIAVDCIYSILLGLECHACALCASVMNIPSPHTQTHTHTFLHNGAAPTNAIDIDIRSKKGEVPTLSGVSHFQKREPSCIHTLLQVPNILAVYRRL